MSEKPPAWMKAEGPAWKTLVVGLFAIFYGIVGKFVQRFGVQVDTPKAFRRILKLMILVQLDPVTVANAAVNFIKQGFFNEELTASNGDIPDAAAKWLGPRLMKRRFDYLAKVVPHFERIAEFEGLFHE